MKVINAASRSIMRCSLLKALPILLKIAPIKAKPASTVISALGIGMLNQSLQQILGNPVLGKILVLGAIILFLQWRPAGIFVTRSRSLES